MAPAEYEPYGTIGRRFAELGNHMQAFLRHWAMLAPEPQRRQFIGSPHFPSLHVEAHILVGQKMTLAETLDYMRMRLLQAEEIAGEIVLRTLQQIGPEVGQRLLCFVNFAAWGIRVSRDRLDMEADPEPARSSRLPLLAQDLERTLGPVLRHPEAARARELLAHPFADAAELPDPSLTQKGGVWAAE